jgi:hypothetical protein
MRSRIYTELLNEIDELNNGKLDFLFAYWNTTNKFEKAVNWVRYKQWEKKLQVKLDKMVDYAERLNE